MSASAPVLADLAPSVRFPVTICVVCYGPHAALASRFLHSLYRFTDPALFHLRAGLNEVAPATAALFREHAAGFGNITLFEEPVNRFKNPLMRRMFREPPPETRWTLWFDDDTHLTRPDWLLRLAMKIESRPDISQWGRVYSLIHPSERVRSFIESAAWHRGLPLLRGRGPGGAEGYEFRFATGGYWALRTEVIRLLDWPDPRIVHANEDLLLGEALRQNGLRLEECDYGVAVNDAPRRNAEAPEVTKLPGP